MRAFSTASKQGPQSPSWNSVQKNTHILLCYIGILSTISWVSIEDFAIHLNSNAIPGLRLDPFLHTWPMTVETPLKKRRKLRYFNYLSANAWPERGERVSNLVIS